MKNRRAWVVEVSVNDEPRSPEGKRRAMTWAQRLKRVFGMDITPCIHCGGAVRIVASIEEPTAIRAILAHRNPTRGPPVRAQNDACTATAYSADSPKRAVELPNPPYLAGGPTWPWEPIPSS